MGGGPPLGWLNGPGMPAPNGLCIGACCAGTWAAKGEAGGWKLKGLPPAGGAWGSSWPGSCSDGMGAKSACEGIGGGTPAGRRGGSEPAGRTPPIGLWEGAGAGASPPCCMLKANGLPPCGEPKGLAGPCGGGAAGAPRPDIMATSLPCGSGTTRGSCGDTGTWNSTGHTR